MGRKWNADNYFLCLGIQARNVWSGLRVADTGPVQLPSVVDKARSQNPLYTKTNVTSRAELLHSRERNFEARR